MKRRISPTALGKMHRKLPRALVAQRRAHVARLLRSKMPLVQIAGKLGISPRMLLKDRAAIGAKRAPLKSGPKPGTKWGAREHLTPDQKAMMIALAAEGKTERQIAERFGKTQPAVHYVIKGRKRNPRI